VLTLARAPLCPLMSPCLLIRRVVIDDTKGTKGTHIGVDQNHMNTRCTNGVSDRAIIKYTAINGVYSRFTGLWQTPMKTLSGDTAEATCHAKLVAWTNRVISPGFIM